MDGIGVLQTISDTLDRRPGKIWELWAYALILVLGILDYMLGAQIGLSVFYLIPISLVAWVKGVKRGLIAAIFSAISWFIAHIATDGPFHGLGISLWNLFIRSSFFLVFVMVTVLLSKLKQSLDLEKELSRKDHLTGVSNRRAFDEQFNAELVRCRRLTHTVALIYIDLDDFKQVNDRFGHQRGDALLKDVASALRTGVREIDHVARMGGDEFAIILPETGPEQMEMMTERLRQYLSKETTLKRYPVTFSIGAIAFITIPDSLIDAVARADKLMYEAKINGKNQIRYHVHR